MLQRQTKTLQLYFFLSTLVAFCAAAQLFTLRPAQPVVGTLFITLGCSFLPFCHTGVRDFFILRSALTWNLIGLSALALVVAFNQSTVGVVGTTAVFVALPFALAVRASFTPVLCGTVQPLRSLYEEQMRETAGQEERNRLARDLHDSIKQQIFAIQTGAAAVQARFDSDRDGARAAIEGVRASAREAMTEMEAMLDQLRAAPLESVGLIEAVKKQCEALEFRTGARVLFDLAAVPDAGRLRPGAALSLFRIAQEALANIARHARATEVKLGLSLAGNDFVLRVGDNGAGFSPANQDAQPGMGLSNMRSRAAEQGGSLDLESAPGIGTQITVTIPLVPPAQKKAFRKAWLFAGAGFAVAYLSFYAPGDFYIGMLRGFSTVMLSAAITYFIIGARR